MRRITRQDLFQSPLHFLAFGFGSGLLPKAPGTMGTLAAVPLVWMMALFSNFTYASVVLFCVLAGPAICNAASRTLPQYDHPAIVWDEIVGMMLTMIFIPVTGLTLAIGFLLFRFFDIVKPWPIRYFDRQVHGGIGIMLDDIIAAICANIALRILLPHLPL
ncbi:phosphatidylglycerophosphatase A family protein [Candidatus Spongiihabitans sp.]|uniref:phosphatidylglycerophosphatase A family protein n=1 Tax=Candidatus Spongiihabitans sp. TaxID=3101308 RepID=UPI003C7DE5FB